MSNASVTGLPSAGSASPGASIAQAIRAARTRGHAVVPFITAGYPTLAALPGLVRALAPHAAAIEIGVPFSDPMADGVTIQQASRTAIANGASLGWLFEQLTALQREAASGGPALPPIILMGYLNTFITGGLASLAERAAAAGVAGLIIPDLPLEESAGLRAALHRTGVGLVQLVSPVTPQERAAKIAAASDGFLYAVMVAGVTGAGASEAVQVDPGAYLRSLKAVSPVPVCAGFGVRTRADVVRLSGDADGVIVGSALVQAIGEGVDAGVFVRGLLQDR